jgi:hypothetical protein
MHTITSPTGASVTKELTEEKLQELQADNYFTVINATKDRTLEDVDFQLPDVGGQSSKPRIHISDNGCESCSA